MGVLNHVPNISGYTTLAFPVSTLLVTGLRFAGPHELDQAFRSWT